MTDGILPKHEFRYIDYEYAFTLQTPMQKAKNIDVQEILIYEIFDLIPNDSQKTELQKLYDVGDSDKVKWADTYLIDRLGFDERTRKTDYVIGPHTKWAINGKYTKE